MSGHHRPESGCGLRILPRFAGRLKRVGWSPTTTTAERIEAQPIRPKRAAGRGAFADFARLIAAAIRAFCANYFQQRHAVVPGRFELGGRDFGRQFAEGFAVWTAFDEGARRGFHPAAFGAAANSAVLFHSHDTAFLALIERGLRSAVCAGTCLRERRRIFSGERAADRAASTARSVNGSPGPKAVRGFPFECPR